MRINFQYKLPPRELRYTWFHELIDSITENVQPAHPVFLLTAHHANDNIETLLMNFFKGTGIKGLRGILPKQGKIIRPLLFAKKEKIKVFAGEHHLNFVEDSSNISDKYTRNYFRNQLIPSLQKVFPHVEDNLMDNVDRFTDIHMLYKQALDLHKTKLLEYKGDEIHIAVLKLVENTALKNNYV
jgi:Predicted ATPase of the PP-loop superfamily implicated in cell cycle control